MQVEVGSFFPPFAWEICNPGGCWGFLPWTISKTTNKAHVGEHSRRRQASWNFCTRTPKRNHGDAYAPPGYELVLFLAGGGWALGRLGISWHKAWSCWTWIWPRYNIEKNMTYPIWTIQMFFKNPYMHFFHCHNPISRNISKIHLGKKNMLATLAVFGHQLISGSFPVYHLPPGQLSMKNYRGSFQGGEIVTEMFAFFVWGIHCKAIQLPNKTGWGTGLLSNPCGD